MQASWAEAGVPGVSTPHQTRSSAAAIFNMILVFAWHSPGLEKQKVFLPDSINFSSSSSSSNLVLSDECLTRVASSGVWGSCGEFFRESVGSPCPYFLFRKSTGPDGMTGRWAGRVPHAGARTGRPEREQGCGRKGQWGLLGHSQGRGQGSLLTCWNWRASKGPGAGM